MQRLDIRASDQTVDQGHLISTVDHYSTVDGYLTVDRYLTVDLYIFFTS